MVSFITYCRKKAGVKMDFQKILKLGKNFYRFLKLLKE
jgi:hypothetical protein